MILAGERIHRPADRHTDQQEHKERPDDVFHAVDRAAAAQKTEGHRNDQCEQHHALEVRKLESHGSVYAFRPRAASYACNAARRFSTPAAAMKRVP